MYLVLLLWVGIAAWVGSFVAIVWASWHTLLLSLFPFCSWARGCEVWDGWLCAFLLRALAGRCLFRRGVSHRLFPFFLFPSLSFLSVPAPLSPCLLPSRSQQIHSKSTLGRIHLGHPQTTSSWMWPVHGGPPGRRKLCRPAETRPAVLTLGAIVIGTTFCFVLWRPAMANAGRVRRPIRGGKCHRRTK
jgi:hypothetical protein